LQAATAQQKLSALFEAGIRLIICLQPEEERGSGGLPFTPYVEMWRFIGAEAGELVDWQRHPITDMGIPSTAQMRDILRAVDQSRGAVYLHCWGGHGRTGTVAGCYLVSRGFGAEMAFEHIRAARSHDSYLRSQPSPQTHEQRNFVKEWFEIHRSDSRGTDEY
jgi:protein tyrosine phosphatase (PTP) superfamily phosphohydrolase (DUF442 family)